MCSVIITTSGVLDPLVFHGLRTADVVFKTADVVLINAGVVLRTADVIGWYLVS